MGARLLLLLGNVSYFPASGGRGRTLTSPLPTGRAFLHRARQPPRGPLASPSWPAASVACKPAGPATNSQCYNSSPAGLGPWPQARSSPCPLALTSHCSRHPPGSTGSAGPWDFCPGCSHHLQHPIPSLFPLLACLDSSCSWRSSSEGPSSEGVSLHPPPHTPWLDQESLLPAPRVRLTHGAVRF